MAIKKYGINVLGYQGVESSSPPNLTVQKRSPLASDYKNVLVGDLWLDSSMFKGAMCPTSAGPGTHMLVSKILKQAQWVNFGGENISQLTGDSGGPVPVDGAGNINVLGTAGRIATSGNPGTNTITWDIDSDIAETYTTDSGNATAASNILSIIGSGLIATSGSSNNITISLDTSSLVGSYTTDSGTAIPSASNINILGGIGVDTSGAGDAITIDASDDVATQITTDSGIATPSSSNVDILGDGSTVSTSGSGDTIIVESIDTGASSAFFATLSAYLPNFTGDSLIKKIPYDTTVFDINSDFDTTTGEFVAPVDGIYFFLTRVALYPITIFGNNDNVEVAIKGTAATPQFLSDNLNFAVLRNTTASNTIDLQGRGFISLTAGDRMRTEVSVKSADPGATDNVGIDPGGSNVYHTYFQGHLVVAL